MALTLIISNAAKPIATYRMRAAASYYRSRRRLEKPRHAVRRLLPHYRHLDFFLQRSVFFQNTCAGKLTELRHFRYFDFSETMHVVKKRVYGGIKAINYETAYFDWVRVECITAADGVEATTVEFFQVGLTPRCITSSTLTSPGYHCIQTTLCFAHPFPRSSTACSLTASVTLTPRSGDASSAVGQSAWGRTRRPGSTPSGGRPPPTPTGLTIRTGGNTSPSLTPRQFWSGCVSCLALWRLVDGA